MDFHLQDLTKRYEDIVVVDELSLTIRAGEFVTMLGPSGSGKTTTLMMIAGFVPPTSGDIALGDRSMVDLPPFRRNIGVVFQHYALFPHMRVFDNVAFPLKMRKVGRGEIKERVGGILDLVRLQGMADRYPRQLSGGQQQRVALARALVYNPPLLLLDEPLGALDKKLREEMQLEIKHIQRQLGLSVIHVTHDQEEALVMSDRICVMDHGRIQQVGSPHELYERPANRFVASFIGESNFIRGEVLAAGEDRGMLQVGTDLVLKAPIPPGTPKGRSVEVAIRPEKLDLLHATGNSENLLEGVIDEGIYIGEAIKYRIRIAGDLTVTLKQHSKERDSGLMKVGERVRVGFRAADVIFLGELHPA